MEPATKNIGFDTEKYLEAQTEAILERVGKFEKLYLEFGGKLVSDGHAERVLPGYRPTAKIELLKKLGDIDIIYCVSAKHVEVGKVRADSGLSYDLQTLKEIRDIADHGLQVKYVVITRCENKASVAQFERKLERLGIEVFIHDEIPGYPNDLDQVIKGYEKESFVPANKKLTIVTGAGGNSGKMATCLSQVYNERKNGINSGYAKFETFPIWNLDLNHPVNIAYEAATADLLDYNIIDPFHEKAYDKKVVNYNRDIENFDILIAIMKKITGEENPFGYKSPTDMGVNMAAKGIIDDAVCSEAGKQEIISRYFKYKKYYAEGIETKATMERIDEILEKMNLKAEDRKVVLPAREAAEDASTRDEKGNKGIFCGAALELPNGEIITGKNSPLLHAESAVVLNAIKAMANISDDIPLLPQSVIEDINYLKTQVLGEKTESLNLEETLIALSVSRSTNSTVRDCIAKLKDIKGCEFHSTHRLSNGDEAGARKLGLHVTTGAQANVALN
jgi:uncharacterized protein (UPF0371 family)